MHIEVEPPHATSHGGGLLGRLLPIAAMLVALSSLALAVYEARMTREHDQLSVWPYVNTYNSFAGGDYSYSATNVGLGPALVRSFRITVDGKPRASWGAVLHALVGDSLRAATVYSSFGRGSVLVPNARIVLLQVGAGPAAGRFMHEVQRMRVRICYCSLYDQCWLHDDSLTEPAPKAVDDCPADPTSEFAL